MPLDGECMLNQENTTQSGASTLERIAAYNSTAQQPNDSQAEMFAEDSPDGDTQIPQDDVVDDLEVETEETETESEEPQDGETEEVEETEEEDQADGEESDKVEYDLSDIAQLVGYDEDKMSVNDDGKIVIKTKVDGEVGEASLDDLVRAYQKSGHLDNRTQKTAELEKELSAKIAETQQQTEAKLSELDTLTNLAYQELTNEYNSIDWNELRADDPAEYAAKQEEFRQRQSKINQSYQAMQYERQQIAAQQQAETQKILDQENQRLVQAIDGWNDEKVAQKEYRQVLDYGKNLGYPEEQLGSIQNHLDVVVLRKAMLYDQMQEKKPQIKKKVKVAPKISKPGQPVSKQTNLQKQLDKARAAARRGEAGAASELLRLKREMKR